MRKWKAKGVPTSTCERLKMPSAQKIHEKTPCEQRWNGSQIGSKSSRLS